MIKEIDEKGRVNLTMKGLPENQHLWENEKGKQSADFVAPRESGLLDHVGAFAVTSGIGVEELALAHERDNDDYSAIMVKALADRIAEAFAERMHERVRKEFWGFVKGERMTS